MKQVRETAAGQSITVQIILRPNGDHIATVQSHYSNGGTVTVDVWNMSNMKRENPSCDKGLQQGRAGGYGYDKFNAAIAGLEIDGFEMTHHCTRGNRRAKDVRGANWSKETGDFTDWYIESDLSRLTARGYQIITAI